MTLTRALYRGLFFPLLVAAYRGHLIRGLRRSVEVARQFTEYRRRSAGKESVPLSGVSPWLVDDIDVAGDAGEYFYQDTWCVRRVIADRPQRHVDVASAILSMGCLSQAVPLLYVDIRPIAIRLPGFSILRGSLTALPFATGSVPSLSSLSVVEHVGLGRYGDPLDELGVDRAAQELARVLAPGGRLYVAVPTGHESYVAFNAHRVFKPEDFIAKFSGLTVVDECYALADRVIDAEAYRLLGRPYAYGCYAFTRS